MKALARSLIIPFPIKGMLKDNIRLFYLEGMVEQGIIFSTPIIIVYLLQFLTMGEILLLNSIKFLIIALLELPTGALSDLFGKRKAIIAGSILQVISLIIFLTSHTFLPFLISFILSGAGIAAISGNFAAIAYETIEKKEKTTRIIGEYQVFGKKYEGLSMMLGGAIASVNYALCFILEGIKWPIIALLAVLMKEKRTTVKKDYHTYINGIKESVNFAVHHPKLSNLIMLSAVMYALLDITSSYNQPILSSAGISVALFGIIYAVISYSEAIGLRLSHKLEGLVNREILVSALFIIYSAALIGLAVFVHPILVLLFLSTKMIANGLRLPIMESLINEVLHPQQRSSLIAFKLMSESLALFFLSAVFKIITDDYSIRGALMVAGVSVFIILILFDIKEKSLKIPH